MASHFNYSVGQEVFWEYKQEVYRANIMELLVRDGEPMYKLFLHNSELGPQSIITVKASDVDVVMEKVLPKRTSSANKCKVKPPVMVADAPPVHFKFTLKQEVLAYGHIVYHRLLYIAYICDRKVMDQKPVYLIHFKKWSHGWDKWVSEDELMPYNYANIQLALKLTIDMQTKRKVFMKLNYGKTHPEQFKYKKGDWMFAYYGAYLYKARCLATELRDGQAFYFVTYKGWNEYWDQWLTEDQLKPINQKNTKLQAILRATANVSMWPESTSTLVPKRKTEEEEDAIEKKKKKKKPNKQIRRA